MKGDITFSVRTWWDGRKVQANGGYSRDHIVDFSGKTRIEGSAAKRFRGNPEMVSPEELFVSSISTCHMLTYLNLCHNRGITVGMYEDQARGYLRKSSEGFYAMERVELYPRIFFKAKKDLEIRGIAIRMVHEAHHECFITNSVKTEVTIEPVFVFE